MLAITAYRDTVAQADFARYVYIEHRIAQSDTSHKSKHISRRHLLRRYSRPTNHAATKHSAPCAHRNGTTPRTHDRTKSSYGEPSPYARHSLNYRLHTKPTVIHSSQQSSRVAGPSTQAHRKRTMQNSSRHHTSYRLY